MTTKLDLAYTAGIVDGEGSIGIWRYGTQKHRYLHLRVNVGNTNEWIVNWLHFTFGGYIEKRPFYASKNWKQSWCWIIASKQAGEFLKLILPYLKMKRPQAELGIKYQQRKTKGKHTSPEEHVLAQADKLLMNSYNKRGRI